MRSQCLKLQKEMHSGGYGKARGTAAKYCHQTFGESVAVLSEQHIYGYKLDSGVVRRTRELRYNVNALFVSRGSMHVAG